MWSPKCLSKHFHHFLRNVLYGFIIAILVFFLHHIPPLQELDDIGIDWVVSWYKGQLPKKDTPHFIAFDIDDKSYREWGERLITPRDKLLELLQFAVKREALFIIVDIELNAPDDSLKDEQFIKYLRDYDKKCKETNSAVSSVPSKDKQYDCNSDCNGKASCPHIIFVRGLWRNQTEKGVYWTQRKTFLNLAEIVANSSYLHWASALFENVSSVHGNLRRWYLSTMTHREGEPSQVDTVLPSVQLLSAVLIYNINNAQKEINLLDFKLRELASHYSEQPKRAIKLPLTEDKEINLNPSHLNRRIIYTLPWKNENEYSYPRTKNNQFILTIIPAQSIISHKNQFDQNFIKGSIVVIGGSHQDSRDIHPTPIGLMPGYLVIINGILSLTQFGELKAMPGWVAYFFIEGFLIFLVSCIFAVYNSLAAVLILTAIIMFIITPASVYLFQLGFWLNFLIPLLGIVFHQCVAYIEELKELAKYKCSEHN